MDSFIQLARERYSVRSFSDREVSKATLEQLLEAGKVAPTAKNCQPQVIFVVSSPEDRAKLAQVCKCTFNAPVILLVGYDKNKAAIGPICENYCFGNTDCAIVTTHLALQAADMGLGSCIVGMFTDKEVREVMGIPDNIMLCDLLPVGYPSDTAVPSPRHTEYRDSSETVVWL